MPSHGRSSGRRRFGTALFASALALASASDSARAEPPVVGQRSAANTQYDDTGLVDRNDANEPGFSGLFVQVTLARAGFFMRPFTAVFDERTRAAIRAFQQASGLSASGAYNDETQKRMIDFDAAMNNDPSLPNFQYQERPSWDGRCASATDKRCVHVEAKGSWLGEDLVPKLRTNFIECDMGLGTCRDTQADVGPFGRVMDISVQDYEIERATPSEIVTRPRELPCVEYVLHIDRVRERVTQIRRPNKDGMGVALGHCGALEQRELHMYLGDGLDTDPTVGKRVRDAVRFLNPPPGLIKPEPEYSRKKQRAGGGGH